MEKEKTVLQTIADWLSESDHKLTEYTVTYSDSVMAIQRKKLNNK